MMNSPIYQSMKTLTSPGQAVQEGFIANQMQYLVATAGLASITQEFAALDIFLKKIGVESAPVPSHLRTLDVKTRNNVLQMYKDTYYDQAKMLGRFSMLETTENVRINFSTSALKLAIKTFAMNHNPMMFESFQGYNFNQLAVLLQFKRCWYDTVVDINTPFLMTAIKAAITDSNSQLYNYVKNQNTSYLNSDSFATIINTVWDFDCYNGFYITETDGILHMNDIYGEGFSDVGPLRSNSLVEQQQMATNETVNSVNIFNKNGVKAYSIFSPEAFDNHEKLNDAILRRQDEIARKLTMTFERLSQEYGAKAFDHDEFQRQFAYLIINIILMNIVGAVVSLKYRAMIRKTSVLMHGSNTYINNQFDLSGLDASFDGINVEQMQNIRNGLLEFLQHNVFDYGYNNGLITMPNSDQGGKDYQMYTVVYVDGSNAVTATPAPGNTLQKLTVGTIANIISDQKDRKAFISIIGSRENIYYIMTPEIGLKGAGQFFETYTSASATIRPGNATYMIGGDPDLYYKDQMFISNMFNHANKVRFFGEYGPFLIDAGSADNSGVFNNTLTNTSGYHTVCFLAVANSLYNLTSNPLQDPIADDTLTTVSQGTSFFQHSTYYDPINVRYTSLAEHRSGSDPIKTNVVSLLGQNSNPSVLRAKLIDADIYKSTYEENGSHILPCKSIPIAEQVRGNQELLKVFVANADQLIPKKVSPFEVQIEFVASDFVINDTMSIIDAVGYFK